METTEETVVLYRPAGPPSPEQFTKRFTFGIVWIARLVERYL